MLVKGGTGLYLDIYYDWYLSDEKDNDKDANVGQYRSYTIAWQLLTCRG